MASPQQVHLREHPECFPYHPDIPTPFGYRPSLAAGITFTIVFMGLFVAHAWQTIRNRNLWLGAAFSLGAFGEFTGWLGRAVAYRCPYSVKLLEMQLASLVMAPAFTTAGIYGTLSLIIPVIGADKSPLKPRLYLIIFMTVDFFSLLLQAIGGGLAGAAFSQHTNIWPGTYTMVAGIVWQLVSTCVFVTLLEYVIYRAMREIYRNPPLRRICLATMISVTCMVARGVYRSIELVNGWRGYVFTHEGYTIALDAATMCLANFIFTVWNPAALIPKARAHANAIELHTMEQAAADEGPDGKQHSSKRTASYMGGEGYSRGPE